MEQLERKWWKPYSYIILCTVIFLCCYLFTGNAAVLLFLGVFIVSSILTVFECPKAGYIFCLAAGVYFFCFPVFYNSFIPYSAFVFFRTAGKNRAFWCFRIAGQQQAYLCCVFLYVPAGSRWSAGCWTHYTQPPF